VALFHRCAAAGCSLACAEQGAGTVAVDLHRQRGRVHGFAARLARRLLDRQDDYLRFTTNWRISAGNNGYERDIRMTT